MRRIGPGVRRFGRLSTLMGACHASSVPESATVSFVRHGLWASFEIRRDRKGGSKKMNLVKKKKKLLDVKASEEYQNYQKKLAELNATREKAADEAGTAASKVIAVRAHFEEVELDNLVNRASDAVLEGSRQRLADAESNEKLTRARHRVASQDLEKLDKALARVIGPVYQEVARARMELQLATAKRKLDHLKQAKQADEELQRCESECKVMFRSDDPVRSEAGVAFGAGVPRFASPTIPSGALAELERRIADLETQVKQGAA